MTDLLTALTTALGTVAGNFQSGLADVVPIALGIMGAVWVIRKLVRAFKSIGNN